jgi:hypothetical protein
MMTMMMTYLKGDGIRIHGAPAKCARGTINARPEIDARIVHYRCAEHGCEHIAEIERVEVTRRSERASLEFAF